MNTTERKIARPPRPNQAMLDRRKLWTARNHGIQTVIAKRAGKSPNTVRRILLGEMWNPEIGALLAEAGAPGFVFEEEAAHA